MLVVSSVESFLKDAGCEKYIPNFQKHEIDTETLIELTDNDLVEMGIVIGPRKKILARIRKLQQAKEASQSPGHLKRSSADNIEVFKSSNASKGLS